MTYEEWRAKLEELYSQAPEGTQVASHISHDDIETTWCYKKCVGSHLAEMVHTLVTNDETKRISEAVLAMLGYENN